MTTEILHKPCTHLFLIAALGLVVYSNTFRVPFQFDDVQYITENHIIRDLSCFVNPSGAKDSLTAIEYQTLKMRYIGLFTFALNYMFHGLTVTGYHIINLLIHIVNALLVYRFVLLMCGTPLIRALTVNYPLFTKSIALFSSLLFVSHPVQTQAVTYLTQRFASLATMLYLLSIIMYIKARIINTGYRSEVMGDRDPSPVTYNLLPITRYLLFITYYLLSVFFAVLAMKTKEISFTLPVIIAICEFMLFGDGIRRRLLYLIPYLLIMLIIPLGLIGIDKPVWELFSDMDKATRAQTDISRWDYLITQFRVIVTYIRLLLFPINQNLDYDYPIYNSFLNRGVFLSFVFLLPLLGIGIYLFYRSRTTIHYPLSAIRCFRLISFGILWFFTTLSVESSVIPAQDVIFEHRMYLPSVGAFMGITASLVLISDRLAGIWPPVRKALIPAVILIIIALSCLTYQRNIVWKDEISLWKDSVHKGPGNARAYNGLAHVYNNKGMFKTALENYNKALALNPDYSDVYYNRGTLYDKMGLYDMAIADFTRAIVLNPDFYKAYNNRGTLRNKMGLYDMAIADFTRAIVLNPDLAEAYYNLGNAYYDKGSYDQAIEQYSKALNRKPDFASAYYNRRLAYDKKGLRSGAVKD